jgi:cbb3-type cytochrome oxidase subunit 3
MFKQFTEHIDGNQAYLMFSLFIFLVFFIVVTLLLLRLRKQHVDYMSDIPLNDCTEENTKILKS